MRILSRDHHVFSFCANHAPTYEIDCNEIVCVETWDAFAGRYTEPDGGPSKGERTNPATGPISVRGIEPGDTLAVEILGIAPKGTGILRSGELLKKIPIVGDHAFFDNYKWRMMPMIGVIGVMPSEGDFGCQLPGPYGGNLDTNDVCAGATIQFHVQIPGGLLGMGDVHARMGEGETNGMGIEAAADITLRVHKEPDPLTHLPYIVMPDRVIVVASEKTLDEAAAVAVEDMKRIVRERLNVDADTARLLVGVLGNLRISQIVNPLKTVRLEMPLIKTKTAWTLPKEISN